MLFIYSSLSVGGIETFFVRMAKERHKLGLPTSVLLLSKPSQSNTELLKEIKLYAEVLFAEDLFLNFPFIAQKFPLLSIMKSETVKRKLSNVDQIHVFHGMHALLGYKLSLKLKKKIPITVGIYHYIHYLWGKGCIAQYEQTNRSFIFEYLPARSLLFFSKDTRDLYTRCMGVDFSESNTFRLGVVDKQEIMLSGEKNLPLKIIAIGRLVEFKTYNFYMLDVIKNLIDKGHSVKFDIYGDGPLKSSIQSKINEMSLSDFVKLKGTLDYSLFSDTVSAYDLFIGSGTAVIQASSLGVPSLVGVENINEPKTYGYFCFVHEHEYNLKGLDLKLFSTERLIENYISMTVVERLQLKESHLMCMEQFTNKACQQSMDSLKNISMPCQPFELNIWKYEFSRFFDSINKKVNANHPWITRHSKSIQ